MIHQVGDYRPFSLQQGHLRRRRYNRSTIVVKVAKPQIAWGGTIAGAQLGRHSPLAARR
jgi:hypothetical protein